MDKPFTTYDEQVNILRSKSLEIVDEDELVNYLKRYGYYGLITGYKRLFKRKDGNYKPHTTIRDIVALCEYDRNLRELFLRYILVIESHIKSLLSYSFCDKYGCQESDYLNVNNYQYICFQKEVTVLIGKLQTAIGSADKHPYLLFQKKQHGNIGLWALTRVLTIGIVSKMYSLSTSDVQSSVSKEFPFVSEAALSSMLFLLTDIRNVCAHNERLFDYKDSENEIRVTDVHRIMKLKMNSGDYIQGRRDLFATIITFKYLLPDNEFEEFINQFEKITDNLLSKTKVIQRLQIFKLMGLPINWTDIRNCPKKLDKKQETYLTDE